MAERWTYRTWVDLIQAHKTDAEQHGPTLHKWVSWYHSRTAGVDNDAGTRASLAHMGMDAYDTNLHVHNNYVFSYMDQMVANIVPQNPQVTCDTAYEEIKDAIRARQDLINHSFRADKLQRKMHRATLWASLAGQAYVKALWCNKMKRPKFRNIHSLRLWYDYTVPFAESRYVIEVVTLTQAQAKERFADGTYKPELEEDLQFTNYPSWLYDEAGDRNSGRAAARDASQWTTIYEVYDRALREVYHISTDLAEPLNSKFRHPFETAEPYHSIVFNEDFETSLGVSDVQLIAHCLDRLNEIDTLELEHGHASIPNIVFNEALVENAEQTRRAIQEGTDPGSVISLRSNKPVSLDQIIGYTQTPGMVPGFQVMRERLTALIEAVLGIPAYMRGAHSGGEVATEFALIDTAAQTRNGRRRAVLDDFIEDLALAVIQLWEQFMDDDARIMAMVDRMTMGSVISREDLFPINYDTDEHAFIYRSIAHSPTENHRLVQLQQLQSYMPVLLENPAIDQVKLTKKLCELLAMEEILAPNQPPAPAMEAPMPSADVMPPMPPAGQDTIATGAVPGGIDETLLPPTARILADQPKVEV